jgi:hypothetical protein
VRRREPQATHSAQPTQAGHDPHAPQTPAEGTR